MNHFSTINVLLYDATQFFAPDQSMSIGFKAGDAEEGVELRAHSRPAYRLPIKRAFTSLMFFFESIQVYYF